MLTMFNYNPHYNANANLGSLSQDPKQTQQSLLQQQQQGQQQQQQPAFGQLPSQYVMNAPPYPRQPQPPLQPQMRHDQDQFMQQQQQPQQQQGQPLPSIFLNMPQKDVNKPQLLPYTPSTAPQPLAKQMAPSQYSFEYPPNQYNAYQQAPLPQPPAMAQQQQQQLPPQQYPPPQNPYQAYYQYNGNYPPLPSTANQQQQPRYPMSPLGVHSEHSISSSSPSIHPASNTPAPNIDYSSIVSLTNSRSIRRKRRKKLATDLSNIDPTESYPCEVCHKVFQKPYNLKSHMKTHSTDKPYQCSHCPKSFARSHDKKRHEMLHNGVKNFKCEGFLQDGVTKWGCGKKFARSDALSRHFRTETGWLCIRPLMEEAKRLEEAGVPSSISVPAAVGLMNDPSVGSGNGSGSNVKEREDAGDESYDNSSLIRKLIQGK